MCFVETHSAYACLYMQNSWLEAGIQACSVLGLFRFLFFLFLLRFLILKPRLIFPSSFSILPRLGHPTQAILLFHRQTEAEDYCNHVVQLTVGQQPCDWGHYSHLKHNILQGNMPQNILSLQIVNSFFQSLITLIDRYRYFISPLEVFNFTFQLLFPLSP